MERSKPKWKVRLIYFEGKPISLDNAYYIAIRHIEARGLDVQKEGFRFINFVQKSLQTTNSNVSTMASVFAQYRFPDGRSIRERIQNVKFFQFLRSAANLEIKERDQDRRLRICERFPIEVDRSRKFQLRIRLSKLTLKNPFLSEMKEYLKFKSESRSNVKSSEL